MSEETLIACTVDKSTLASVCAFAFEHLSLSLTVDFGAKQLSGSAQSFLTLTLGLFNSCASVG